MDSTTLLYNLRSQGEDVLPLLVDYGQRHRKELNAARHICLIQKIGCTTVDLSSMRELLYSALTSGGEVPEGHYSDEIQKATVVPNRNMILLAVAAGYAESMRADYVAYAAHSNDRAIYPDCRPEFIESVRQTIKLGTGGKISLVEPFVDLTKADLVAMGLNLGVPFEKTWSCYKGNYRPCLECGTCLERIEAFDMNGVADPLLTLEEWEKGLANLTRFGVR
jgi:7-cyano-7-deazaguanine synthase